MPSVLEKTSSMFSIEFKVFISYGRSSDIRAVTSISDVNDFLMSTIIITFLFILLRV